MPPKKRMHNDKLLLRLIKLVFTFRIRDNVAPSKIMRYGFSKKFLRSTLRKESNKRMFLAIINKQVTNIQTKFIIK
jgi:hypothetical protein